MSTLKESLLVAAGVLDRLAREQDAVSLPGTAPAVATSAHVRAALATTRKEAAGTVAVAMGKLTLGSEGRRRAFDQVAYLRSYAGGMTATTYRTWAAGWRELAEGAS